MLSSFTNLTHVTIDVGATGPKSAERSNTRWSLLDGATCRQYRSGCLPIRPSVDGSREMNGTTRRDLRNSKERRMKASLKAFHSLPTAPTDGPSRHHPVTNAPKYARMRF